MSTKSLRITEEELERRIAEAATKASKQTSEALAQAVKALANDIVQVSPMRVPLKINSDELLLITVDFAEGTSNKRIDEIVKSVYNAFKVMGITRVLVLTNTKKVKFDVSLIKETDKETDVDVSVGDNISRTPCKYDGTMSLKQ